MCGRYTLTTSKIKIAEEFQIEDIKLRELPSHYNIAPSSSVPVLVENPKLTIDLFRWGLIPSWAKDPTIGSRMINARKETLIEKPSFKGPLKNRRCLILADGFYEWKGEGTKKTPYYIRMKSQKPFGFAGLWSHWLDPKGNEIYSCTIITGEPNELIRPIHNRMPMILAKEKRNRWLDSSNHDSSDLLSLLETYPTDEMEAYVVSRTVNSPSNNSPECIQPA